MSPWVLQLQESSPTFDEVSELKEREFTTHLNFLLEALKPSLAGKFTSGNRTRRFRKWLYNAFEWYTVKHPLSDLLFPSAHTNLSIGECV